MISVIVPVYNAANYLRSCLDSILQSTYKDVELILIDDGSIDGSKQICDQYAGIDNRVRVVHQDNAGISAARNAGLDIAAGEYIGFVDSDDLIHPQMLQILHTAITSGNYDFSMVLGVMTPENFDRSVLNNTVCVPDLKTRVMGRHDLMAGLMGKSGGDFQYMVVWNKLYKRSLLQDLRFNSTSSEDMEWNTRVCVKMNQGIYVDAELYYWIQHGTSFTHQPISLSKIERINSYLIAFNEIPPILKQERSLCLEKMFKVILHTRYHARNTEYCNQAAALCRSTYQMTIRDYLASGIPWYNKYGLLLFYHVPSLYSMLIKATEYIAKK